jgi:hypothetical protein
MSSPRINMRKGKLPMELPRTGDWSRGHGISACARLQNDSRAEKRTGGGEKNGALVTIKSEPGSVASTVRASRDRRVEVLAQITCTLTSPPFGRKERAERKSDSRKTRGEASRGIRSIRLSAAVQLNSRAGRATCPCVQEKILEWILRWVLHI